MRQILFVCTGNVFRSMTAEHALRHVLGPRAGILVSSAGTADDMCTVDPIVAAHLHSRGIDVSGHRRRTLTADMLHPAVTVVAMSTDHREFIARRFGHHDVPLFTQACGLAPAPLLDVGEAISDPESNLAAVEAYIRQTIDRILELTPQLARRLVGVAPPDPWLGG
jgi:protein-tyrosine phosphatase